MSYAGRIQDALHDVLESIMPDGATVDWKMRSKVAEAVNLRALPIFEAEVELRGAHRALHALTDVVLAKFRENTEEG